MKQYQNLNETYVVFITENDVLGENIPIYHVDRIVRETGKMFNDQSHIIYVNSQIKDETALGKLMHDFTCTNAKDMYYEVLADRVHYFKEDEKGVAIMCKAMEDMRNEAAREAEKMKAIRMARLMIEDGKLNYEDIAMYTELTLEEVEKIALEKKKCIIKDIKRMFCFVEQLCIPDCGEVAKKAEAEAVFKELLASCTSRLARTTLGSDPMWST